MPLLIDSVDDRVKLQLGELMLSNIVLADQLEQAQKKIMDLTADKQPEEPTKPGKQPLAKSANGAPAQPS